MSGQQHAQGRTLPPGKNPVPILQEAGWAPGPVWTGGKSRPYRDSIPDHPARILSLYRLSHRAHRSGRKCDKYRKRGETRKAIFELRGVGAPVASTTDQLSFAINGRKMQNSGNIKNLCKRSDITKGRSLSLYQFNRIPANTVKLNNANEGNKSRNKKHIYPWCVCVLHSVERYCVCVLHSVQRHCVCTAQCREALFVYCTV